MNMNLTLFNCKCCCIFIAHKAQIHGKGLGKVASKQARTLEFEFTLPPRNRQGESSRNNQYRPTPGGG